MRSFFEYLGIADMERIHSQMIAWILSSDFQSVNQEIKNKLLYDLFPSEETGEIFSVQTEVEQIDIQIETRNGVIIIENKFKSSQHSNQLERYKISCDNRYKNRKIKYFYLTLIGEKSGNPSWINVSYEEIYNTFKQIMPALDNSNSSAIYNEYMIYLGRLIDVINDFKKHPMNYGNVFINGGKSKINKSAINLPNENERFIASNQLETILQKYYLNVLSNEVSRFKGNVTETRGDALIDFQLQNNIIFKGKHYATMIQLQKFTLKFAIVIQDNYNVSKSKWVEDLIPFMREISITNKYGFTRLNKPKSKAYISISKQLMSHYWLQDIKELAKSIDLEIDNGLKMTQDLIGKIQKELPLTPAKPQ